MSRVVKSFSELEQDWNNNRRGPHRVCVHGGFRDDNMLFWFWFAISIVLCFIFPLSGIISFGFWAIIFRHKIKDMLKRWLH